MCGLTTFKIKSLFSNYTLSFVLISLSGAVVTLIFTVLSAVWWFIMRS